MDNSTFTNRFESDYRRMYEASPDNFNALDYVGALGTIRGALLYSKIFLPDFVEVSDMIFLQDVLDEAGGESTIQRLYKRCGNKRAVEEDLNRFDLQLNFPNQLGENAPDDDRLLAEQLAICWHARLRQLYPNRSFVVKAFDQDGENGVVFYQS